MGRLKLLSVDTKSKTALENLIERGIFDERDIDYLNHLEITQPNDIVLEGIIRAKGYEIGSDYGQAYSEIKGWFLGIESKRKYIEDICEDLIDWLIDKRADYRDLDLDMGSFKTWMKTSESFFWRYYFLLEDNVWRRIESDLNKGNITDLETLYSVDITSRKLAANNLDSITDIDGLIKIVKLYKERSNKFFELIMKRKIRIKSFPFQVILLGATDLRRTVKKIVNLAI